MSSDRIVKILKKELGQMSESKATYVIVAESESYREVADTAIKLLTKDIKLKGVYACLNTNADILLERFKKIGADMSKLVLIDSTGDKIKNNQTIVVDSPKSLTALSLTIGETVQAHEFDFLFIDSLSTLLMYNSLEATEKFVHFMLNKMKNMHLGSIVIAMEGGKDSDKIVPIISQFCDKVIKI